MRTRSLGKGGAPFRGNRSLSRIPPGRNPQSGRDEVRQESVGSNSVSSSSKVVETMQSAMVKVTRPRH